MQTTQTPVLQRDIYSISRLNRAVHDCLREQFAPLWIAGEISNLVTPASGHCYFSLKDANAQVRCAMFRQQRRLITIKPENGMQVLAYARISLYEPRGDYQLIIEHLEAAGDGLLRSKFELLKNQLQQQGLFATERKQTIPPLPKQVGVITSASGAAIRDIISVARRRFAAIPILIYPSSVQGANAAPEIVAAIELANQRQECDVLILARGGGSLEDLWPFNEEIVARAIDASRIPIVSGVGHEIDITIADFVADQRAATPSAAAECVFPNYMNYLQSFANQQQHLIKSMQFYLQQAQQTVIMLKKRLRDPQQLLQQQAQKCDHLTQRLQQSLQHYLATQTLQINNLSQQLQAFNPCNTLKRGYAIVFDATTNKVIQDVAVIKSGQRTRTQVHNGEFISEIQAK